MWIRSQRTQAGKPLTLSPLMSATGASAADGRDVALVAVAERASAARAAQARLHHLGHVAPLLHGDRRDPEQLLRLAVLAEYPDHVAEGEDLGMPGKREVGRDRDAPSSVDLGSGGLAQLAGRR